MGKQVTIKYYTADDGSVAAKVYKTDPYANKSMFRNYKYPPSRIFERRKPVIDFAFSIVRNSRENYHYSIIGDRYYGENGFEARYFRRMNKLLELRGM